MYKIDPDRNRTVPLEAKRFGELCFTKRKYRNRRTLTIRQPDRLILPRETTE